MRPARENKSTRRRLNNWQFRFPLQEATRRLFRWELFSAQREKGMRSSKQIQATRISRRGRSRRSERRRSHAGRPNYGEENPVTAADAIFRTAWEWTSTASANRGILRHHGQNAKMASRMMNSRRWKLTGTHSPLSEDHYRQFRKLLRWSGKETGPPADSTRRPI